MEKELAIMIADLSGYTALTEVHGAHQAADLIEKFVELVEESLIGSSYLQERRGDEVLVMAEQPEDLLATSYLLHQRTACMHGFLQLHGGLHFGSLLERKGNYFGTAINFTARIASVASPGHFWCSNHFRQQIRRDVFRSKGTFSLRNLEEAYELFEIIMEPVSFLAVDPVCRMLIMEKEKAFSHPDALEVYFCSEECLGIFLSQKTKQPG